MEGGPWWTNKYVHLLCDTSTNAFFAHFGWKFHNTFLLIQVFENVESLLTLPKIEQPTFMFGPTEYSVEPLDQIAIRNTWMKFSLRYFLSSLCWRVTMVPAQHSALYNMTNFTIWHTVQYGALYNIGYCTKWSSVQHSALYNTPTQSTTPRTVQHGALYHTVQCTKWLTVHRGTLYKKPAHCTLYSS